MRKWGKIGVIVPWCLAMNEERIAAYVNLIQQLLACPSGEENQILNQFSELVDEGFMQVCELVAAQLQEAGQENNAGFLRNVAQQVGAFLAEQETGGNQQAALGQFWQPLLLPGMVCGIFGTKPPGKDKSLAELIEQAVKNNTNLETSAPSPEQNREKPQS